MGGHERRCPAALFDAGGPAGPKARHRQRPARLRARAHPGRRHGPQRHRDQAAPRPALEALSGASGADCGAGAARILAAGAPPLQPARRRAGDVVPHICPRAPAHGPRAGGGRVLGHRHDAADALVPPPAAGPHGAAPLDAAPLVRVRRRLWRARVGGPGVRRRPSAAPRTRHRRGGRRDGDPVRPGMGIRGSRPKPADPRRFCCSRSVPRPYRLVQARRTR